MNIKYVMSVTYSKEAGLVPTYDWGYLCLLIHFFLKP